MQTYTGRCLFYLWTSCALNTGAVYAWDKLSQTMQDRWNEMARQLNAARP